MSPSSKIQIGIVGCGAIGSRIARSIQKEFKGKARVSALFDIDPAKSQNLARDCAQKSLVKKSLPQLLRSCDLMIEAVNAVETQSLIRQALSQHKDVLAMSVGKLLNSPSLFRLAQKNCCRLLIPSGAIAGVDAVKAASLARIDSIILTTRKPPFGFKDNAYITRQGIDLAAIQSETVLFDGNVKEAVRFFPQNINVAATLTFASLSFMKVRIRIITSPAFTSNCHEIEVTGDFGRIFTRTENVVCPDNPKTSFLAVLSAIQTLKQYLYETNIGT